MICKRNDWYRIAKGTKVFECGENLGSFYKRSHGRGYKTNLGAIILYNALTGKIKGHFSLSNLI